MTDLTAVVLTKDEEAYIADCLKSLQWCDRVLVLDSLSADRTVEIARELGAEVVLRPFQNFADQRNAAIGLVSSEWILFVDADERVSTELAEEVRAVIRLSEFDGWWVPTKNNYFGRWLSYGGFYPDYHLRLARKARLRFDALQRVHEHPTLQGKAGYLRNPLIHLCYQSLAELRATKARYAALLAEIHFEKGTVPTYHLIAAPILTFGEQLLVKKGYKDGWLGLFISLLWGYFAFDEYRRLLLLWLAAAKRKIVRPEGASR
ncbi:MAG: glycosyltransferase family 2 protein [Actinobacteria bacterium]|nr:glycosyltransferase family 2 protein [Actinomycetota bacterium]